MPAPGPLGQASGLLPAQGPGFHLGLQGRQRRAQLMSRIGDETALALGLRIDQREQTIERAHQGPHLGRRSLLVNRAQIARRAALHRLGQLVQRLEGPAHRPVNGHGRAGDQQQIRQQHMHQQLAHPLLAHIAAVSQHDDHFAGAIGFGLEHGNAIGHPVMLLAMEFRRAGRRHIEADPGIPGHHIALQIAHGIAGFVALIAQKSSTLGVSDTSGGVPSAIEGASTESARAGSRRSKRWSCWVDASSAAL